MNPNARRWLWTVVLVAAVLVQVVRTQDPSTGTTGTDVAAAFDARASDVQLTAAGRVIRILGDDNRGDRHQRFIIRIGDEQSVLVVHNIDLAPRVPVSAGDSVDVFGEYVWNEQGGLIHWTHHDPDGSHVAGWIRHRGREYQ